MHLTLLTFLLLFPFPILTMKFLLQILPQRFLRKNKSSSRSLSGSNPSFTSSDLSDDAFKNPIDGESTPTSVLPAASSSFDLKQAFAMLDRDGDGKILKEDFEALLRRLGSAPPPSKEELQLMVSEDGDDCITLEEFNSIGSAFAPPTCDEEMRETFDFFDGDGDGKITADELFEAFGRIGGEGRCTLEECRRMIRGVDTNGDGFVCLQDFSRMMKQNQRLR